MSEKYMSKEAYDEFVRAKDEFKVVLLTCAQEICQISKSRDLRGEWDEDIDMWDDWRYLVQFESYSCGDTDYDSVYVPLAYICDEAYRSEYRKVLVVERKEIEARIAAHEDSKTYYTVITDERATYERLKAKFEDE